MLRLFVLAVLGLVCDARLLVQSDPVFDGLERIVEAAASPTDIDKFLVTRDWAPYAVRVHHELDEQGREVADVYTVRVTLE